VHAFVAPVLLRLAGLDEFGRNAERDPPDGELREARNGGGSEGRAVVGADSAREAELAEEMPETAHRCMNFGGEQGAAFEEEPGVAVLDGEREAELAVLGTELAFEVRGPGAVGLGKDGNGRTGMLAATARFARRNATFTAQDPVYGVGAGCDLDGGVVEELFANLASSPAALVADLEDAGHDLRRGRVGTGGGTVRAALEAVEALGSVALDPEVAGGARDVVAPAELGMGEVGDLRFEDKAGAFSLHGGGPPRHRALPVRGAPRLRGEL